MTSTVKMIRHLLITLALRTHISLMLHVIMLHLLLHTIHNMAC